MGNSADKNNCFKQYRYMHNLQIPFLGTTAEMLDEQTNTRYLMKTYTTPDLQSHRNLLQRFRQRKPHRHILQVHQLQEESVSQLCSNSFKVYVLLDYYEFDLWLIFQERQRRRQYFSEDEFRKLLSGCVLALIYFHDNGIKHCYLTKQSMVSMDGNIKLIDETVAGNGVVHPYYQFLAGRTQEDTLQEDVYLAPELLLDLKNNEPNPYFTPKADIYALGVIMLELATLESMAGCFNYQQLSIQKDTLSFKLNRLRYSHKIIKLLQGMLQPDPEERIGLLTLKQSLELAAKSGHTSSQTSLMNTHRSTATLQNQLTSRHRKSIPRLKPFQPNASAAVSKNQSMIKRTAGLAPVLQTEEYRPTRTTTFTVDLMTNKFATNGGVAKNVGLMLNKSKIPAIQPIQQPSPCDLEQTSKTAHHSNNLTQRLQTHDSLDDSPIPRPEMTIVQNCSDIGPGEFYNTTASSYATTQTISNNYAKIIFDDGRLYQGQVSADGKTQHGNGVMYSKSGKLVYSGSWSHGKFDGFGTLFRTEPVRVYPPQQLIRKHTNAIVDSMADYSALAQLLDTAQKYEGQFKNGHIDGFGQLYLCYDIKYNGLFRVGRTDGIGSFHFSESKVLHGVWTGHLILIP